MKKLLFFIPILFLFKCDPSDTAAQKINVSSIDSSTKLETTNNSLYKFPYDLTKPNLELKLSKKLVEISGLSLTEDQKQFIAINDEQGKLFFLDKEEGKLLVEEKFHKKGDYEGIEAVGERIFVVKNNGTIYEYKEATKGERPTPKAYKTILNEKNDQKLQAEPIYHITQIAINEYLANAQDKQLEHLAVTDEKDMVFSPSGIAVHPHTKNIYILSSVGKALLVLDKLGKNILSIQALEKKMTKQPEGIAFDKEGTLFISSEGRSGKGRIFHFKNNN